MSRGGNRISNLRRWIEGRDNAVGTTNDTARAAWVEQALAKVPAGGRILDAGAGEQRFKPCCSHLQYVAQDFAQYDGTGDGHGLQMGSWDQSKLDLVCDITAVPEPEASFDAVLCVEVFEHLPEPLLALKEFARLVKPGGHLILTAPFCSLTHFAPYHFATGFSRYYYETHLPAHGFRIEELTPNGNYFEYLAQELRRLPEMSRQYAGHRWSGTAKLAQSWLLRALGRCSATDTASSEVLHFGYHVRARRKTP
jgi:SAM-dependent methyltransferase